MFHKEKGETHKLIIGDLNARVSTLQNLDIPDIHNFNRADRQSHDKTLNQRGKKLMHLLENHDMKIMNGYSPSDEQGHYTFCNKNGNSVIDLCLASNSLQEELDLKVLNSHESCHFPILVTATNIKPTKKQTKVWRTKWEGQKENAFNEHLEEILTHHTRTDITMQEYIESIQLAAKTCGAMKLQACGNSKLVLGPRWFNSECLSHKRLAYSKLHVYRKAPNIYRDSLRIKYTEAKRTYNHVKKTTRTSFYDEVQSDLTKVRNTRQFFKALSVYKGKQNQFQVTEHIKPSTFQNYYANLFKADKKHETQYFNYEKADSSLDSDFSFKELNTAIKLLAIRKAPGPDAVINELWKALNSQHRLILLDSINDMYRNRNMPEYITTISMSPIYKKGDKGKTENYRPISLVNTGLKLITILLGTRLNDWCENNKIISDSQAAYRKGYGCEHHIFCLNAILQSSLTNSKKLIFAVFVDLSKAFDSIPHTKLWQRLIDVGISSKFLKFLMTMYSQIFAFIKTPFGESDKFPIQKSVLQGESLSPKLFTIFIEELVNKLRNSKISHIPIGKAKIHVLLYADDIIILATNAIDLQEKVSLMQEYFSEQCLIINLEKTKLVIFHTRKRRKRVVPNIMYGQSIIEIADKYTYLGVTFYSNMDYHKTCTEFLHKSDIALKNLLELFRRSKMHTLDSRLKRFDVLVRSVLFYGSGIWASKNSIVERINSFQSRFLRSIFLLPYKTPRWFLRLEANDTLLELLLLKNTLKLRLRILKSHSESLIRQCYENLVKTSEKTKCKHNWYRELQESSVKWGFQPYLKQENHSYLTYNEQRQEINKVFKQIRARSIQNDIESMRHSTSMPNYQKLRTHVRRENFLNYRYDWHAIRTLVQLRANLGQITAQNETIKLNVLTNFYDASEHAICNLCKTGIENNHHVMFECTHYKLLRVKFLKNYECELPRTADDYESFFKAMDESKLKNITLYVKFMLLTRKLCLE
ncbi:unnamed protein product [Orchesella dallaii]|uniref:Reverse transcriptase domain-containing protein n=1 Tax=Orchesella dallaii TaxID=48710 RepID=A0ABP1RTF3_9HEXA